jgi:hypothetical protein
MKLSMLLTPSRVLQIACTLALVALALIVWSLLDPRPIPVILAMSVAQGLGTLSFAAFLFVVVRDLRTTQRKEREALERE